MDWLDRIYQSRHRTDETGLQLGLRDLDHKLTGLEPGTMTLVAGRPAMGKTSLTMTIAKTVAKRGRKVAVFSLEMPRDELFRRWVADEAGLDSKRLRTRLLDDDDWANISARVSELATYDLYIDDRPRRTTAEIAAMCRRLQAEVGLDLIVIDDRRNLGDKQHPQHNWTQHVTAVAMAARTVARQLGVPIIMNEQLNRRCELRNPPRPMLSDLRDSGELEAAADNVLLLYREAYYNPDSERKNVCEVIIAKQRNGPDGVVELYYDPALSAFRDLDKTHEPPAAAPPRRQRDKRRRRGDDD